MSAAEWCGDARSERKHRQEVEMQFSRISATAPRASFQSQGRLIELGREVKSFRRRFASLEYRFTEIGEGT